MLKLVLESSKALEPPAQHTQGELTQLRAEEVEELCRCHWDWNLWWLWSVSLPAQLTLPIAGCLWKNIPSQICVESSFGNQREHGKETQPGTCFGFFGFFCPCIPFQLWYEVDHSCCSCAFKGSRIPHLGQSWETLAGTVYTSVLPYVCECIFCVLLNMQYVIYCHIPCMEWQQSVKYALL